jgi:putative ABC transport system permease protein
MKLIAFVLKNARRNPVRTTLTLVGVAVAIFIYTAVLSLNRGMNRMLQSSGGDDVLVVYDRYEGCPPMSKLPVSHQHQIEDLPGVADTTATLFLLSACSRATDLVAVHGIEPDSFRRFQSIELADERYAAFASERGAAIVGEQVARRFGWQIGQTVSLQELDDLTFTIRGIFRSPGNNLENTILVDLEFLQRATDQIGTVTLIYVKPKEPQLATQVAAEVDALLGGSSTPTKTTPERSFMAAAISGVTGIVAFSRWLGYVALGIILLGVGNSLSMSVRDRTREIAILKTIGFRRRQLLPLIVAEAALTALAGGVIGSLLGWLAVNRSGFYLAVEGFTLAPHVSAQLVTQGIGLAALIGVLAGVMPAFFASRLRIVTALKEVD